MLDHALQYAGRGWRVFPCHSIRDGACSCGRECASPGKHPRTKNGVKDATTDSNQIIKWWTRWPDANIGIATGNGLTVIDVDGTKGLAELGAIIRLNGPLPMTLAAETGNGLHLYFAANGLRNKAQKNVHVRGDGGYVIAPPSNHKSGKQYRWLNVQPLAQLPEWFKELLQALPNIDKSDLSTTLGPKPAWLTLKSTPIVGRPRPDQSIWSPQEEERIRGALFVLTADNYDTWVNMGMALHSLDWQRSDGSDIGFDLWDEWSATCDDKYSPAACADKWASFKGSGITIGSLFHRATETGRSSVKEVENGIIHSPGTNTVSSVGRKNDKSESLVNGTNGFHVLPEELTQKADEKNPLIRLNKKHCVIGDIGGKCLVLSWVPSKVDDSVQVPSFQSFKSFSERYANRYIQVGEEVKQIGQHWLKWPARATFEGIDLIPNGPPVLPNDYLNLWSGFAVTPVEGCWDRMRAHIVEVLAAGDRASAEYIWRYAAWAVQNPGERAEVALVFRGEKGTGKGTFANALKNIFGQHGLQIWHPKHFIGAFNAHLRNCLLLYADEAFWAGDKQGESILKGMLTEPTLMIEQKGVDATPWKNRLHVVMTANNEWVVPASHDERRYVVMDVSSCKLGDEGYFAALHAELRNGGLAAMLHAMLAADLKGWHPRKIINTKGLMAQKLRSLAPFYEWWEQILQAGLVPGQVVKPNGVIEAITTAWLLNNAREHSPRMRDMSANTFSRLLREHGCIAIHSNKGTAWRFPDLEPARSAWEKRYRGWAWHETVGEWRR